MIYLSYFYLNFNMIFEYSNGLNLVLEIFGEYKYVEGIVLGIGKIKMIMFCIRVF